MARVSKYHHGGLREAVMCAALKAIAKDGVSTLSLRHLARDAGVSHGAPAHHFGDRKGLFTALAIAGCQLLIENLQQALSESPSSPKERLRATGVAYVHFAMENPAYFQVMFRPELHNEDDPELVRAFSEAKQILIDAISVDLVEGGEANKLATEIATLRAWSTAHGLANLILSGNIRAGDKAELASLAAKVFSADPGFLG